MLTSIRIACIKANPSEFECNDLRLTHVEANCPANRPIRLADVLLAIGHLDVIKYKEGFKTHPHNVCVTTLGYALNENGMHLFEWNLRQDDLTEQSDYCVSFLYELLK